MSNILVDTMTNEYHRLNNVAGDLNRELEAVTSTRDRRIKKLEDEFQHQMNLVKDEYKQQYNVIVEHQRGVVAQIRNITATLTSYGVDVQVPDTVGTPAMKAGAKAKPSLRDDILLYMGESVMDVESIHNRMITLELADTNDRARVQNTLNAMVKSGHLYTSRGQYCTTAKKLTGTKVNDNHLKCARIRRAIAENLDSTRTYSMKDVWKFLLNEGHVSAKDRMQVHGVILGSTRGENPMFQSVGDSAITGDARYRFVPPRNASF